VTDQPPRFSVIVPVFHPEPDHLGACIRSVTDQTYHGWELLLVADGPQPLPVETILVEFAASDPRIKVMHNDEAQGIAAATQRGLVAARHQYLALLDHDDVLSLDALGAFAAELARFDDVDLAYSDEDKIDAESGKRKHAFYKPAFSPERLRTQMYLGHLMVVRRELALAVGGFRSEFDGAQDHDLALRVAERARRVVHLPRLLYHWRESESSTALDDQAKDWAFDAGVRAVADHLARTAFPAVASRRPEDPGVVHLEPSLTDEPVVSVIIPTGAASKLVHGVDTVLVEQALSSLIERSSYSRIEVVVVCDAETTPEAMAAIEAECAPIPHRLIRDRRPFNFANACNLGAIRAEGDVLVFLNDDTEVVMPQWLERLVMYATRPDIGAVGARLLYGDGRIQHAGVWSRATGPSHRYAGFPTDHPGNFRALRTAQNCLAVTAACLAVERDKFEEIGGFSPQYPLSYNDVDLCLKLLHRGYRNVVDCATVVTHHESASRNPTVRDWEIDQLRRRWGRLLNRDPYDNPCNLGFGVEEYPGSPIDVIEAKIDRGEIDITGRSWPGDDTFRLGTRSPRSEPELVMSA
jgi:GT2 family glycosyltransferase